MPASCCKPDYDAVFDARTARREAEAYRRSGVSGSTRRLVDAIRAAGTRGATVLDIGGGVEIIGMELLAAGADSLTGVDASRPYVAVARHELRRRGLDDRSDIRHGDFVELAGEVDAADIVTLDRVVCCYGDWRALLDASLARTKRLYGLVYPNERWWMRLGIAAGNAVLRLSGHSYRAHIHPERRIDERIRRAGFGIRSHHRGWLWQTVLYERLSAAT